MKKLYSFLTIVMMAMMAVSLTSCDDEEIARTLEGTWEGNMYASSYSSYYDTYYDATYSEVCFLRDPYRYSSGTGYWVDYYDRGYWGGYNYIANHIEWRVDFGTLYVYFVEDDYELRIYDYDLDDNYFVGVIVGEDGQRLRFSLRHVSSPNWNNYRWGYADYYDPYYYSNENATGMQRAKAKDGNTTEVPDRPQRVFGRTKKD
ncbi:MAG: hypothetical protein IKX33_01995 [Prevotella sp.]|nr:hypothetical protein [Prevotella sp.]